MCLIYLLLLYFLEDFITIILMHFLRYFLMNRKPNNNMYCIYCVRLHVYGFCSRNKLIRIHIRNGKVTIQARLL